MHPWAKTILNPHHGAYGSKLSGLQCTRCVLSSRRRVAAGQPSGLQLHSSLTTQISVADRRRHFTTNPSAVVTREALRLSAPHGRR